MSKLKLGDWADIDSCDAISETCTRKVSHIVLLNTPNSKPYVVGECLHHHRKDPEEDFPSVTVRKFEKTVRRLIADGVSEKEDNLAWAVMKVLDPMKTQRRKR